MNKRIKIGILGCANIAKKYLIPEINRLPDHYQLIGVASRSEENATHFAELYNTKAFYSYDSLLSEKDLNAIYIPLPNSLHYEWAKKSLQQNIHVLVEKPSTCSHEHCLELNSMAKEKKLVFMENFQFRFHSQLEFIKDLIKKGEIGELRSIKSSFGFPPFGDISNIRYKKELGGGALFDAGVYPIKISQIIMGPDINVKAASLSFCKKKDIDMWGSALLKQKNSALTAQISFGFDNYYQCNLELWGSKGCLSTNRIFTAPPGFEPSIELETSDRKKTIKLKPDNHFKNMLLHFHNLFYNEENTEGEYKQNINQARLLKELRENADEQ